MNVTTTCPKTDRSLTIEYDFGENLQECVAKFGEEVVFTNARARMIIACQNAVRGFLSKEGEAAMSDEDVAAKAAEWIPGVAVVREKKSAADKALDDFETMTDEERADYMKKLRARAKELAQ